VSEEQISEEPIVDEQPAGEQPAVEQSALVQSAPERYPLQPLSPSDERTWAMLAHLSVLLNLVTGILGPVAALVIYLAYKDRSRYVAYHAWQSFIFQLIWWVGGGLLSVVVIGCCLMPIALLISMIPLAALVYGTIGAIQASQGQDFEYWLIGEWARNSLDSE
jgi:uncharacterized Tic20 family protein